MIFDIGSILFVATLVLPLMIPVMSAVMRCLNCGFSYITAGDYDEVFAYYEDNRYKGRIFKGIKIFGKKVEMFTDVQCASVLWSFVIGILYLLAVSKVNEKTPVSFIFNDFTGFIGCLMLLFLAIWGVLFFLRTTYVTGKKVKQIKNQLTDHINDTNAHN